jgi:Leucine-rich repeat (LRR) protein
LDGTTFSVAVPEGTRVAEMKRAIGALREVPHYAMELFVEGKEEPLDDEKRLLSAEKVPLFMLPKQVSDRLALEALYKSCGGADWEEKGGWMTDAGLGEWFGVDVDAEGRVTELNLGMNNLAGPLPSELQQLSALKELRLRGNKLTGPVPAELGQLGALTQLNLHYNQLSGPIPAELRQLGALTQLLLHRNQLSGPIPAELGQLGALEYLWLQDNPQLSGQEALRLHLREHKPGCSVHG